MQRPLRYQPMCFAADRVCCIADIDGLCRKTWQSPGYDRIINRVAQVQPTTGLDISQGRGGIHMDWKVIFIHDVLLF